ncbi:flavodoxin family protein [Salinibacterium sp. ZJ450]|uniref:flavodoxin family protein n=1 Tax=Salinibacterium sp. ZJ450 TaxID=2708338 RepID=UPI0014239992|nr:flavodoxin family protein [Salinibacterium sp. ZJ450]
MKAFVVYESMFGNTEAVARAVAEGLGDFVQVQLADIASSPAIPEGVDLIVAGGPTHAFSMTRESTREDAVRQGATHGSTGTGLREWLDALPAGEHTQLMATFDTRVDKVRHLPGSAAKGAAKLAHRHGYPAAAHAESFWVSGVDGPLLDGELERATRWGEQLGALLADRT